MAYQTMRPYSRRWLCGVCAELGGRAAVPVWLPRGAFIIFATMHLLLAGILYAALAYLLRPARCARPVMRAAQDYTRSASGFTAQNPSFATVDQRFRNLDDRVSNLETSALRAEADLRRAFRDLERRP